MSIIISCCTTGFAAATMWYDYDTSPEKRRKSPKLAGAVPDTSRGPFFFVLAVSGALQVVAKSFSSALLIIASPNYFLAFMVGDHALFQIYNDVRGDHRDYNPGSSVLASVALRICQKVVADYTSCWLFRNPLVMHNAYFLFNQLTAHASVFVSVHVYVSYGFAHLSARALWMSAGSLFAAWALTYVVRARERSPLPTPDLHSLSLVGTSSSRAWSSPSTGTSSTPRRPACSSFVPITSVPRPTR